MNWARGSGSISNHGSNVGLFAVKVSSKDNKIEIKDGSASQFGGECLLTGIGYTEYVYIVFGEFSLS